MNDIRTLQPNSVPPEHSDVEHIKQQSKHLRGTIEEGLFSEESGFGKEDIQLIKFHGIYQQKNRDLPKEQAFHSFMLRGRIPGGRLTAGQYLGWDLLANEYGNGSLRITTRQALQLHGILKGNLQATLQSIHKLSLTTLGACGDVVRNVTQSVNPWGRKDLAQLDDLAQTMSDHFKFTSNSYAELWLNGEKVDWQTEQDPIYKEQYLPRKFKIGVTLAGHNDIDLYTNCLGLAATVNENQEIDGAFVFAGGGMGMTHNKPDTFPRAADLLGWVPQEYILTVAQSIVEIHRDWGDRTNRKHSRLKYVLAEKGVEWFKKEVEQRSDVVLDNRPLPAWNTQSYLGWHEQVNGKLALGMHILSGRIVDTPAAKLKSALRAILEAYHFNVQLTADQDLILLNIEPNLKGVIEEIFADHDVQFTSPDELRNRALACPALPTCTLAVTESERVFNDVLEGIHAKIAAYGLLEKSPIIRMTGCPNGCARPYSAEIGIVGQAKDKYAIFVGGNHEGTKIGRLFKQKIPLAEIPDALEKLLGQWKENSPDTYLGEYVETTDWEDLLEAC